MTGPVANFPVADSFNRVLEKDVSTGDIPNVFVTSVTYELPFERDARSIWKALRTPGWRMEHQRHSASPVGLAISRYRDHKLQRLRRFRHTASKRSPEPNLDGDQRSTGRWFDTSAFTVAPQFTLGNTSRNPVRGPGYRTADIAFIKWTYFGEVAQLRIPNRISTF